MSVGSQDNINSGTFITNLADPTTPANLVAVSATGALKVDGSAVTQPVSGTVTANAGTNLNTSALALQSGASMLLDRSGTGTITALNGAVTAITNGASTAVFNIVGTWVATLLFEGQDGNGNWLGLLGSVPGNGSPTSSTSANIALCVPCGGFNQVRVRASLFTSGTATINYNVGAGFNSTQVFNLTPAGLQATARLNDGSGNAITSTALGGKQRLDVGTASEGVDGSTAPTNSIQVGGKDGNGNLQAVLTDTSGYLLTPPIDGVKTSYSAAAVGFASAAAATDVFIIKGSATKTIRVTHIEIDGSTTAGSGVSLNLQLIKRSTADTGGTFVADAAVAHDSNNAAATATVGHYTANPTLGTAAGTIRSERKAFAAVGTDTIAANWDFGVRPAQAIVLRGVAESFVVSFGGATVTGPVIDVSIEWSEE